MRKLGPLDRVPEIEVEVIESFECVFVPWILIPSFWFVVQYMLPVPLIPSYWFLDITYMSGGLELPIQMIGLITIQFDK